MGAFLTERDAVVGVLLAGGRAERLGGRDKAFVPLAGRPLVAHAIARLAPQCDALLISANDDPARFAAFGAPVVADETADFPGPLAGLLAALDDVAQRWPAVSHALTLPVDTPFAPPDLLARLAEAKQRESAEIAVAASADRLHHAVALWPVAIRAPLRSAFENGERSVGRFAARHTVALARWPAEPFDPFFNINTLDDLAIAEVYAKQRA